MEQKVKPTKLEEAAEKYGESNGSFGNMEPLSSAFEAGAQWQKEQDKKLFNLLVEIKSELYPSIGEMHPSLFDRIKVAVEEHK